MQRMACGMLGVDTGRASLFCRRNVTPRMQIRRPLSSSLSSLPSFSSRFLVR